MLIDHRYFFDDTLENKQFLFASQRIGVISEKICMKYFVNYNILILITLGFFNAHAQDTYSIVAVDAETGEVGSAGASCVDLNQFFPNSPDDFIAVLHPGLAAINTQAAYNGTNQNLASDRALQGDSADAIIDYLLSNDAELNSRIRQYGVALLKNGNASLILPTLTAIRPRL